MLVYGYRTWTRDKTVQAEHRHRRAVGQDRGRSRLDRVRATERRSCGSSGAAQGESYWWGARHDDRAEGAQAGAAARGRSPAPAAAARPVVRPAVRPARQRSAGSAARLRARAAGSGSAGAARAVEMEETRKIREFPLGDNGDKLVKTYARGARAARPRQAERAGEEGLQARRDVARSTLDASRSRTASAHVPGRRPGLRRQRSLRASTSSRARRTCCRRS